MPQSLLQFRIAHIIDSLDTGGAEMMAVNLVNALHKRENVEVHLVVARGGGALSEKIAPGVQVLFLNKRGPLHLGATFTLLRYCRKHRINILHAHSTSLFIASQVHVMLRTRLVWHDHYGLPLQATGKRFYTYKPFLRFVSRVFAVSHALKEHHSRLFPGLRGKVVFVPNFVAGVLHAPRTSAAMRHRLVLVAANRPQKAWALALRACAISLPAVPDLQCTFVGDTGDERSRKEIDLLVRELNLQGCVHFAGQVNDVSIQLRNADLAMLSSNSEGLPLALLEYGLAGLPVVCTDVGDCKQVLGDGKFGWLVPPGDEQALADSINYILRHKEAAIVKGKLLQQHVKHHYTEQAVIHKIIEYYKTVLVRS